MPAQAAMISGGRLHLQHGPIDLIIGAEGPRAAVFAAAKTRFATVLDELVPELSLLRQFDGAKPEGEIAQVMWRAAKAHGSVATPMAAVAGSVAQTVLAAMVRAGATRGYVNNGGDIALHLATGDFTLAVAGHDGIDLGRVQVRASDPVRGIATSGRHGRSHSLGIADSVTVLAATSAEADVAATLIANAIDLPGHSAITRVRACDLDDTSDLGRRLVVTGCGMLSEEARDAALQRGVQRARMMQSQGLIVGAALFLQGAAEVVGHAGIELSKRRAEVA